MTTISRGQWLAALVIAIVLHLLVLAAMRWSGAPETPPSTSPKGVMITLDDFDSGRAPPASIDDMPIENLRENDQVSAPQSAAADAVPEAADNAGASSPPPAAAPIGPESAQAAPEPGIPDAPPAAVADADSNPGSAPSDAAEPAAGAAAITAAVSVRPDTTLADTPPDQQVTARDATDLPSISAGQTATIEANGAFGNSEEATNAYIVKLRAWLSRYKRYPKQARSDKRQGTVKLFLAVDGSGKVLEHRIAQSSGVPSLDRAVNDMVTRAEPLPAIPPAADRNRLELVIPIVFTLR